MREFRKPDLNAPRYRRKVYKSFNDEFCKKFIEKFPQYSHYKYGTLKKIISLYHEEIQNEIIENRNGVELEQSLGYLFLGTCLRTSENRDIIDYGKSIKHGIVVSHKNWETDGNIGKIFYTNYSVKYKVQDRQIWKFLACRKFTRKVKSAYPKDWTKYVVVDNRLKISKLFVPTIIKDREIKKEKISLETYNEFDI